MTDTLAQAATDYKLLVRWPATPLCGQRKCKSPVPLVPFLIGRWWWFDCPSCEAHLAAEVCNRPGNFMLGIPF